VLVNLSAPVVDIEVVITAIIAVVKTDAFLVFVGLFRRKEEIVIYPFRFAVSFSPLVTASDTLG
jgi:hypothetical protein